VHVRTLAALRSGDARVVVQLRREGLGWSALRTQTCPRCQAREATQQDSLSLRKPLALLSAVEDAALPATYALACLLLLLRDGPAAGLMVLIFGPALMTGVASLVRMATERRVRCKLSTCPSCSAQLRHLQQRTRFFARVKNACTWGLVMLAPSFFLANAVQHVHWMLAMAVLAGSSMVAWLLERRAARDAGKNQPALADVQGADALVAVPGTWEPVLRRENAPLLPG